MPRTMKVIGKGKLAVQPDTIRLNIQMEGTYPDYAQTYEEAALALKQVKESIHASGLNPEALKTSQFGIETTYESYSDDKNNWKQRFVGYTYRQAMHIDFPNDSTQLGKTLYQLSQCPANVVFTIQHTVKDPEAVRNQLLAHAVEDCKAKAEVLSEAAGVRLSDILQIDYAWADTEIASNPMRAAKMNLEQASARTDGAYDIDLEVEAISIEDSVTITWEIA